MNKLATCPRCHGQRYATITFTEHQAKQCVLCCETGIVSADMATAYLLRFDNVAHYTDDVTDFRQEFIDGVTSEC